MANIARLGVVLGLNSSEFTTGVEKAKKKSEELSAGLMKIGIAATAVATSIGYLVKQSINNMDALAKQAQMAGVTVESLSGLSYAADLAGVSQDALTTSLARLSKGMSDAKQGTGEALKAFEALKIDPKTLQGTDELLLQLAERFQSFEDGAEKTALAIALFGRAGAQLIPFLNSGKDGIEQLRTEAEKLGVVISTQTAKDAEVFNDSLTKLNAIQQGLVNQITTATIPALNTLTQLFFDSFINADGLRNEMNKLVSVKVEAWAYRLAYGFGFVADIVIMVSKGVMALVGTLGLAIDGIDLLAANYVKILAISDKANEQAAVNLAEAKAKFAASAEGVANTFKYLTENAFSYADGVKNAMEAARLQALLPFDEDFGVDTSRRKPPAIVSGKDGKADKMANMLKEASFLSAEYERERNHSLQMLRIKSQMDGLTENERRVQQAVNEVLNATSKKLQEIADKREAAAGRDASAETLAEYDKQAEAVQRLGEQYAELARIQETSSIEAQRTFSFGWNQAFAQYAEDATNYATMARDMFSAVTGAMSTAIDNFVEKGKFSFKDFAGSIIKDLIKIELKMQAMQLFRMGFNAISGAIGGSIGGSASNPLAGDVTTMFAGMKGAANGGVINSPTLVGERGAELFIPGRSGTVIPNNNLRDVMGGGGVTYNGTVIQNMNAIDTQSGLQFLAKNKMNIYALNQSAGRSMPASR